MAPPHRETRHLHRCRDCASLCTCGGPKIRSKIPHSASTKAFSVASRPPVIQGLRKICTTPLSLRLLGNLAKEGQCPQMWSRKSPHRLYLTTFSPIAPGPVSKTRVAPEQHAVSRAPKFRGAPIFLRLSGTAAPERHEARKGSKIPRTP